LALQLRVGEGGCSALVQIMNDHLGKSNGDIVEICVHRFEERLAEECAKTRLELSNRLSNMSDRISRKLKTNQRWLIVFLVVQAALTALTNLV
jgi:hypothetical protein